MNYLCADFPSLQYLSAYEEVARRDATSSQRAGSPSSNVVWQFRISDSFVFAFGTNSQELFVHSSSNRPVSQEQQCLKKVWDESQKADNQARGCLFHSLKPGPSFHGLWLIHFAACLCLADSCTTLCSALFFCHSLQG